WHTLTDGEIRDTNSFESASLDKIGLNRSEIESRYRSTYFQHIFSGGYSSGYYSYIWSAVLDSDGFEAFKESGDIFNPELAAKYREHILESGGTAEGMDLYREFRGAEPGIEPLLRNRGLDGSGE
ncbi:MAG: M3 family metallopeptidase, partial [Planctomycetota bacterium]